MCTQAEMCMLGCMELVMEGHTLESKSCIVAAGSKDVREVGSWAFMSGEGLSYPTQRTDCVVLLFLLPPLRPQTVPAAKLQEDHGPLGRFASRPSREEQGFQRSLLVLCILPSSCLHSQASTSLLIPSSLWVLFLYCHFMGFDHNIAYTYLSIMSAKLYTPQKPVWPPLKITWDLLCIMSVFMASFVVFPLFIGI